MDGCQCGGLRKSWELPFVARPEKVADLRRSLCAHLTSWGLSDLIDAAQICVSELVANVITHIGPGTPTTLAVFVNGANLRMEVCDPDTRALPMLLNAASDEESGRGIALVDALADRWGVIPTGSGKKTWCEIGTESDSAAGRIGGSQVATAEALLTLYARTGTLASAGRTPLSAAVAEEATVSLIADLLQWLRAHGHDPDSTLDRAQMRFEAEVEKAK